MVKLVSKSIHVVALIITLVFVLPFSAILQESIGSEMRRMAANHACTSSSTEDESSNTAEHSAKPCPVLELRAGLALLSLKPLSSERIGMATVERATESGYILLERPPIFFYSDARISATDQSVLQVLRI